MPEATMVGVRRAPDLDRVEDNGEVWVQSLDLEDLLLSDSEFIPAESWQEALDQLEARHAPPDPALYRVIRARETSGYRSYGRRYGNLPERIIVLKGWYWTDPRESEIGRLEELAQAFGPILIWRGRIGLGWRQSDACQAIRGWDGYGERSLVVRDWLAHKDDRSCDPVIVYEPKRAAAREKSVRTREARIRREGKRSSAYAVLSNRREEFVAAVREAVDAALEGRLRRDLRRRMGPAPFVRDNDPAYGAAVMAAGGPPPFLGYLASEYALNVSVMALGYGQPDNLAFAAAVHDAVLRRGSYRDLPAFGALLDYWRAWPADVDRKDVEPETVAFLDAELAAARKRRPRKPKAAAPAAAGPVAEEAA